MEPWNRVLFLFLVAAILSTSMENSSLNACRFLWFGTAPFCMGSCPIDEGWQQISESKSGDGATCWTGTKVLCQICDGLPDEICHPNVEKTECWGLLLLCHHVMVDTRTNSSRTCGTHPCGPCLGVGTRGLGIKHQRENSQVLPVGNNTCKEGFVWRLATPVDHVCVLPETRFQVQLDNGASNSRSGGDENGCPLHMTWRQAVPGDNVCVPFPTRALAILDNELASTRVVAKPRSLS